MGNAMRHGRFLIALMPIVGSLGGSPARAQADESPAPPKHSSAPRLVREANELLRSDNPAEALKTYEEAARLRPDAREIAFDQGLAHYRLGQFDEARASFQKAAVGASDLLADDAMYGLGAIDHAQALSATEPKEALAHVENAMRNYQTVLGNHPEHAAARDANLKAASYWRQLKQQLEQQQQQQQQQPSDSENQDQQEQNQQQQSQEQQPQDQQQQQQQQQSEEQQQQEQTQASQDQQESKPQEQQEQMAQADEEDNSQEQAERKLREMIQAMQDRKKHRKEDVKPTFRPAEKDW